MNDQLFLATSAFKYYIGDGRVVYKVIQPLFGTYDEKEKIFSNFNGKNYYEITDKRVLKSNERIGFYNLVSFSSLIEKYHTNQLEEIVTRYFDEYKRDGYLYDGCSLIVLDYVLYQELLHILNKQSFL